MTLQEHIRTLRKERGLSQEALAEALGVSRQAVTKWEDGSALPSTANLLSLADFFGVPLEQFVRPLSQEETRLDDIPQPDISKTPPQRSHRKVAVCIARSILVLSVLVLLVLLILFPGAFRFGMHTPEILSGGATIIGGADGPTTIFITRSFNPAVFYSVLLLCFSGFIASLTFLLTLRHYERKKERV